MPTYAIEQFEKDPNKALARGKVLETIMTTYPTLDERQNINVLHLTGPSLIEDKTIFKQAGIPAHNVYGVEINSDIYHLVEAVNLRSKAPINLHFGSVQEFLRKTTKKFGIISLDFDKNYGRDVVSALDTLFDPEKRVINEKSLLYVNVQAKRENVGAQNRLFFLKYAAQGVTSNYLTEIMEISLRAAKLKSITPENLQLIQDLKNSNKQFNQSVYAIASSILTQEINPSNLESSIRTNLFFDVIMNSSTPTLRRIKKSSLLDLASEIEDNAERKRVEEFFAIASKIEDKISWIKSDDLRDPAKFALYYAFVPTLIQRCMADDLNLGLVTTKWANMQARATVPLALLEGTFPEKWQRIPYVSSTGCPMEGQIFNMNSFNLKEKILGRYSYLEEDGMELWSLYTAFHRDTSQTSACIARGLDKILIPGSKDVKGGVRILEKFRIGQKILSLMRNNQTTIDQFTNVLDFTRDLFSDLSQKARVLHDISSEVWKEAPSYETIKRELEGKPSVEETKSDGKMSNEDKKAVYELIDDGFGALDIHSALGNNKISPQTISSMIARRKNPVWRKNKRIS